MIQTKMNVDPYVYRRKQLPHWRKSGSVYFVTWCLDSGQAELKPGERDIIVGSLEWSRSRRCELLAYVAMNDHVHAVVEPYPDWELQRIVHDWKSFSSHQLCRNGRTAPVWEREYVDRIIRNEEELHQKLQYTVGNPWRRWPELTEYKWVYPSDVR